MSPRGVKKTIGSTGPVPAVGQVWRFNIGREAGPCFRIEHLCEGGGDAWATPGLWDRDNRSLLPLDNHRPRWIPLAEFGVRYEYIGDETPVEQRKPPEPSRVEKLEAEVQTLHKLVRFLAGQMYAAVDCGNDGMALGLMERGDYALALLKMEGQS